MESPMAKAKQRSEQATGGWSTKDAERFDKLASDFTKKKITSAAAARKYLKELGTHTAGGQLTRKYGG
ncbi:MAG TPA: hypothetical protein DCG58_04890 [Hyphomonas adhaerens]|jgi:hypothetical protein|uniref:Uncharacterized protein n=2 Tax=Hyphomonadaceae TaxID=69657 RepID=A0A3B9GWV4_9PROT|nr:hypothetical protein [Hyphomonas sp.]HAE26474.1 hypothetical protein [Hyphomonas adhaerens]|tara:strand:- start:885 stop:1088 length:204 start_codon:yes stop_codon:yes gene_type:complete